MSNQIEIIECGRYLFRGNYYMSYKFSCHSNQLYTVGDIKQKNEFAVLLERHHTIYVVSCDLNLGLVEVEHSPSTEIFGRFLINHRIQTLYVGVFYIKTVTMLFVTSIKDFLFLESLICICRTQNPLPIERMMTYV